MGAALQADGETRSVIAASGVVYNSEPAAAAIHFVPDVIGMLVYANHDSLLAALDKKITAAAASSDAHALTPEQKERQIATAMEALFAAELDEATLTFQAWQNGLPVEANSSINPAALLALGHTVAPPAKRGTSPEFIRELVGPR